MFKPLASLLAASLAIAPTAAANTGSTLTVDVAQLEVADGGKLVVMVYNSPDIWLNYKKRTYAQIVDVTGANMTVTFEGLPAGQYGVSAVQDLNGNNKVDMAWKPVPHPIERQGVSNNVESKAGPPSFKKAQFTVAGGDTQILINVSL